MLVMMPKSRRLICFVDLCFAVQTVALSRAFTVKLIGQTEESDIQSSTAEQSDLSHRWPRGIVPYEVAEDAGIYADRFLDPQMLAMISSAIEVFNDRTCIQFIPHSDEENFIQFIRSDKCMTTIGRIGGPQQVELGPRCTTKGAVLHEMLHVLGFGHEHQRPDRDEYIDILWDNVNEDNLVNLEKDEFQWGLDVPYDYTSIMHYGEFAFSKEPGVLRTIAAKSDQGHGDHIGQRDGLSHSDIEKVGKHYLCVDKQSQAPEVYPSCLYHDRKFEDGQEFNEGAYVMRCSASLNGAKLVEPVACLDGGGIRREDAAEWKIGSFVVQCRLVPSEDGTNTGDGARGVVPVGCVKPNGEHARIGDSWPTDGGAVECILKSDGSIATRNIGR